MAHQKNLFWGSLTSTVASSGAWDGVTLANCSLKRVFVESSVGCEGTVCGIVRIRESDAYDNAN
jgi:hypothetical protein